MYMYIYPMYIYLMYIRTYIPIIYMYIRTYIPNFYLILMAHMYIANISRSVFNLTCVSIVTVYHLRL